MSRKLFRYSLTAGAVLAVAQPAGAAVHFTDLSANPLIIDNGTNGSQSVQIDLNGDATNDFSFTYTALKQYSTEFYTTTTFSGATGTETIIWTAKSHHGINAKGLEAGNSLIGGTSPNSWNSVYRLNSNDPVPNTASQFVNTGVPNLFSMNNPYNTVPFSTTYGAFANQKGFIGVKFNLKFLRSVILSY